MDAGVFLTGKSIKLYRLARAKYANLCGLGAALHPGRWNDPGQEAIYTSLDIATPVLEVLAHLPDKRSIPSNYAMMAIRVSGNWKVNRDSLLDPETDAFWEISRSLSGVYRRKPPGRVGPAGSVVAGRRFIAGLWTRFALAVPSVIVPAWNVVLFPKGTGFWKHVSVESIETFAFDPRLFPEGAATEPPEDVRAG